MQYLLASSELDELIGLIEPSTTILIEGAPGTGKTTFAMSIAYRNAVYRNAKVTYIALGETTNKLISYAEKMGFNIRELISAGRFDLIRIPMVKSRNVIERLSETLTEATTAEEFVVVIDSVTPLLRILEEFIDKRAWIQSLVYDVFSHSKGILILVADIFDRDPDLRLLEFVSDVVFKLSYTISRDGTIERWLYIKKFRGHSIKTGSIPFDISDHGIIVLNYVSNEIASRSRSNRKSIQVRCTPAQKLLFSDTVEPGTQILIIDKRGWIGGSHFLQYLVKAMTELVDRGYKVVIECFDAELLDIVKSFLGPDKYSKLEIMVFDPRIASLSHLVTKDIEKMFKKADVDVYLVLGLEKVVDIYDEDRLKKFARNTIQNLKSLGITTIRYYRQEFREVVPEYYVNWSDIVVEVDLKNGRSLIRLIKNLRADKKIEVEDKEFLTCVQTKH